MDNGLGLQQEVVRLQAPLETSRKVHGTIHLDEVLHCALEIAVKELEADSAFFERGEGLGDATRTHYADIPLELPRACDIAGVPLMDRKGQTITRLTVMRAGNPLSMEEQDFLEGLALQTSVAIENARHHQRLLAWERMQKDLAAARAIQRSLLPQNIPEIPGYEAGFRSTTCYEVGGDYVDVLPESEGRFMMMVADVAGKGLASALVAASFRAAFRAMVSAGLAPVDLANRMSALHYGEGPEARRRYVTAILFRLDTVRHQIEVVNTGHNPG
ncbi:MAG: phosphoserine phosphatase RsbU/P [Bryobacterales bacterium]|nr:phosphoserine phosphatase RsbU/P [Bryobacterales bacterium]